MKHLQIFVLGVAVAMSTFAENMTYETVRKVLQDGDGITGLNTVYALERQMSKRSIEIGKACQDLFELDKRNENQEYLLMAQIRLLAMFGDEESAELLVRHITYRPQLPMEDERISRVQDRYPCVEALIRIGKAGSHACLAMLRKSGDQEVKTLLAHVVKEVEGPEVAAILLNTDTR